MSPIIWCALYLLAQQYGQPYPYSQPQQYPYSQYGQPNAVQPGNYPGGPAQQATPLQPTGPQPTFSSPWSGQGPIIVPPISFVDVNSGRFGKLEIDLEDGVFLEGAVDRLHFVAREMDLTKGSLASLDVD